MNGATPRLRAVVGPQLGPKLGCALLAAALSMVVGCGASTGTGAAPSGGGSGGGGHPGLGGSGHPSGGGGAGGKSGPPSGGVGGSSTATGGRGGSTGVAGSSGPGGGGYGSGGFGGAAPGCFLSIQPVAPTSFSIEAGPGVMMRVQGRAAGTNAALTWSWTVTYADGNGTQVRTTPVLLDGANPGTVVEFPVEHPGLYQIFASVSGDTRCTVATQVLTAVASTGLSFVFRTTTAQYPVQETVLKSTETGPVLPIAQGLPVAVEPVDVTYGLLLPSYVRITSPSTSFAIEGDTTRTPLAALLLPHLSYDVLIVPEGAFAPLLLSLGPTGGGWRPVVDPGIDVLAHVRRADDSPVPDARLLLRRGTVPSTLGISDAAGLAMVQARPGSLTATIVPPDGSGLAVATTKDPFDLAMVGAPELTMRWDELPAGTLSVRALGPDGVTPVANAQVWLYSALPGYRAGVLSVGDTLALDAGASVASSVTTDAAGQATFPPYPVGPYLVTVLPPDSASPAAVTTVPVVLPAGAPWQTVTLSSKVIVSGTLRPLPDSGGALIRAVDAGTPPSGNDPGTPSTGRAVSTQAASDGTFSLALDPGRDYQLILQPISNAAGNVGRAVLKVSSAGSASSLGMVTLPAGQLYQGTVMLVDSTTPRSIPNAFIQVYCASSSVGCVDPAISLAEATSRGDGSFSLVLPQAAATVTSGSPRK